MYPLQRAKALIPGPANGKICSEVIFSVIWIAMIRYFHLLH